MGTIALTAIPGNYLLSMHGVLEKLATVLFEVS